MRRGREKDRPEPARSQAQKIEYDKLFITAYIGSEAGWRRRLEENEIKLLTFHDLMRETVRAIDGWERGRRSKVRT